MHYSGLNSFISDLEKNNEIHRISTFTDPVLEITEISDRVAKAGGKALLFENNGTEFPLLINAFGSLKRLAMALGSQTLDETASEIGSLFNTLTSDHSGIIRKIASLPELIKISGYLPSRTGGRGACQQVINRVPDLGILPVLKCWPHDGGRFVTLPMVHTIHPVTRRTNLGMYRMQVLDSKTTAMHWQLHKTGAAHYAEWKKQGKRMPVTVTLGGDPVYTYAATAPLPENIDEYILAGFLRKRKVKLVRCITNELYIPEDADIVIEGYVDTEEEMIWEGPFGDHTGFYSLADWYPKFHVTCITHSRNAVYPATIVGIPPMEDAFLTLATEKIFLTPLRLALQPEITDLHMPDPGTAHNLVIVRINKTYPGQGKKVISSLFGAGQMMFTKYLVVVSGDTDIRDYKSLVRDILRNASFKDDLVFTSGPMDVLDHSSDNFAFGGKLGIDATVKDPGEISGNTETSPADGKGAHDITGRIAAILSDSGIISARIENLPMLIIGIDHSIDSGKVRDLVAGINQKITGNYKGIIVAVDINVRPADTGLVAWQVLGNSDPRRDILLPGDRIMFIDGTLKCFGSRPFPRKWPNIVCSSAETIEKVDSKWNDYGIGPFIPSPSLSCLGFSYSNGDEVAVNVH